MTFALASSATTKIKHGQKLRTVILLHQILGLLLAVFLRIVPSNKRRLKHVCLTGNFTTFYFVFAHSQWSFPLLLRNVFIFIFAAWDECFLVGGGLHWTYRQKLGQTAQTTQDLWGRVNLLLYTVTHVYSYPPISGSTQCQVSVLRLYAVLRRECAIILDFFFDEHRQKAHVLFEFYKNKKSTKIALFERIFSIQIYVTYIKLKMELFYFYYCKTFSIHCKQIYIMIIEAITRNKKLPPITFPVYGRRNCLCPMRGFFMVSP